MSKLQGAGILPAPLEFGHFERSAGIVPEGRTRVGGTRRFIAGLAANYAAPRGTLEHRARVD
jgi:hypothetical protein